MRLTSAQKELIIENDAQIRRLEKAYNETGDPEIYADLNRALARHKDFTKRYTIFKYPESQTYRLHESDWDLIIGAMPIIEDIPESALKEAEKVANRLPTCPVLCYGTPGCKFCKILDDAREIHRTYNHDIEVNVPTWKEWKNETSGNLGRSSDFDDL